MCYGFGAIIVKNPLGGQDLFFSEPDLNGNVSHATIINRYNRLYLRGIDDRAVFCRNFVRIEVPNWHMHSFHFDEPNGLPTWAYMNECDIQNACCRIMDRVQEKYLQYKRDRKALRENYKLSWGLIYEWDTSFGYSPAKIKATREHKEALKELRDAYRDGFMLFKGYVPLQKTLKRFQKVEKESE